MIRVSLSGDAIGWVKATDGTLDQGATPDTDVMPRLLRTPPTIVLDTDTHHTGRSVLRLRGTATDDVKVKDYYVFVFHTKDGKTTARKVAYKRGGEPSLAIDTDVPLKLGMNRVRIVVRDSDKLTATQTLFVYRK
jgi:hypothetical protein